MRTIFLIATLLLAGCEARIRTESVPATDSKPNYVTLPEYASKFTDGNVTCYTVNYGHAISCITGRTGP